MQTKKVALVTGASSGIGAAIATKLGAEGFAVAINYAGNATEAEAVRKSMVDAGGAAVAIRGDVGKSSDVRRLFDETEKLLGPVNVLVNNAGRAVRKPIAEFSDEDFDSVVRTNFYGTFYALREASTRMPAGGRIVNISMSFQGPPIPGYGVYFGSKAAIEELTRVTAKELGPKQISVNALRPGPTRTKLFLEGKTPEVLEHFKGAIALGRLGEPSDIADVVSFLVGPQGAWITGQSFAANGGYW